MVRVKICGITNIEDALCAVNCGADALGFVFADSPRKIDPLTAKNIISRIPPWVSTVGVFLNEEVGNLMVIADRCRLDYVQLHGEESPEYCKNIPIKVIKTVKQDIAKIPSYRVSGILIDTYDPYKAGGTGKVSDWNIAVDAKKYDIPLILAGGLTPENVAEAVGQVSPYGVDVSSGVENEPGKKDWEKVKKFICEAKKFSKKSY